MPQTVESRTGGGGRHLYYAHPGGHVGNRAGLRPGIDLRGDGGCIVLPPSIHPSGNAYAWVPGHAPGERPLAALPAFFLAAEAHR
jgi:Bifunctional DNA primase/polymerase, N-terminal